MLCDGAGGMPRLLPYEKTAAVPETGREHSPFKRPPPRLARCLQRRPARQRNFDYGAQLTELALLGILSLRTGKKIYWDAANMKATDTPEADPVLKESYRSGWEI